MAGIITTAPVVIAADTDVSVSAHHRMQLASGNLYVLTNRFTGPLSAIFKSATGATWAEQDSGSEPSMSTLSSIEGADLSIYGSAGALIRRQAFTPDAFGAQIDFTPSVTPQGFYPAQLSNGNVRVPYSDSALGGTAGFVVTFASGAWGSEVSLGGSVYVDIGPSVVDSSDVVHFMARINSGGAKVYYQSISAGGTPSSPVLVHSDGSVILEPPIAFGSTLIFPFLDFSGTQITKAFVSTNAGATWNTYAVNSGLDPTWTDVSACAMVSAASEGWVYWTLIGPDYPYTPEAIYRGKWTGSGFDAPELFYDAIAYPPTGFVSGIMTSLGVVSLGGKIRVVADIDVTGGRYVIYMETPEAAANRTRNRFYSTPA